MVSESDSIQRLEDRLDAYLKELEYLDDWDDVGSPSWNESTIKIDISPDYFDDEIGFSIEDIRDDLSDALEDLAVENYEPDFAWFSYDAFADQIIFLAIRYLYNLEQKSVTTSLYHHALNEVRFGLFPQEKILDVDQKTRILSHDAVEKKLKRSAEYLQHYRDAQIDIMKKRGYHLAESQKDQILAEDNSGNGGISLTDDTVFDLFQASELPLIKKIYNKTICKSKNVSNSAFRELFGQYYSLPRPYRNKYWQVYIPRKENDVAYIDPETVIQMSMRKFEQESLLLMDWIEAMAEYSSEKDLPIPDSSRLALFYMPISVDSDIYSNRPLIIRRKMVSALFDASDSDWDNIQREYTFGYSFVNYVLAGVLGIKLFNVLSRLSYEERSNFIVDHYWLWNIKKPRDDEHLATFLPDPKIRKMRKLYDILLPDIPKPPSKKQKK